MLNITKDHNMSCIHITCSETNGTLRKIIELLGGNLIEIYNSPTDYFGWHENIDTQCIYK